MTHLTLVHLRFDCVATTPIKLGGHFAGNSLRNAFANILRRNSCVDAQNDPRFYPSDEHVRTCPACWLLTSNLDPGTIVRTYAFIPPLPPRYDLEAGERFSFGLSLFGDGRRYLPYFVLALNEAGQSEGLGPGRREGMGRYRIEQITAVDPLRQQTQVCLAPGGRTVQLPTVQLDWTAVAEVSAQFLQQMPANQELTIRFQTPTRLVEKHGSEERAYKTPDFSVFFQRLLYRIDELNRQFADHGRRDPAEVQRLHQLGQAVRLVESDIKWHEMWAHSGRKNGKTPLSGFTGTAVYWAEDWSALMPWLVWGQATQAGKSIVKGNGVYEILFRGKPAYWSWGQSRGARLQKSLD